MAFIRYVPEDDVPEADRVADRDNVVQIHAVHPRVMRQHYDLYLEVMRRPGPIPRVQREMIAVVVSATNGCRY
ncbi:MAG: carboxymuconolactone decarboxylase family protein [Gemmatimonadetes bacterium]|nr:carboxymuconolactone decarboxylase family protein [Gemmatimonadota bacterium]